MQGCQPGQQEQMNSTPGPCVSNCYVFKSLLQEYAQKAKLPNPTYNTIKEGPSHEPSFRSTVIVNDVTYDSLPGFFIRRDAEQSAAEVALKALANSGAMGECISQPVHDTGLCKNLLQAYAQKMNFAIPLYVCHRDEKPGMLHFICTVDIGGIKYIGGAAKSKREAELKAARTALLAIQSDPSVSSMKVNASSSAFTVVPGKKKVSESVIKAQETAAALKPKKGRYKKKPRKRPNRDGGKNGLNAKDNVNVNNEGHVAPEAIKTGDTVSETTDTGFPPTGHEKLSEFNGGDQSVYRKFSVIQHSGGDFLERPITTLDNVNVNNEGQVAPEAIKTGDIVSETTDTGFPPTGESHEKLSEFTGGDQSVDRKFSVIQHSGGDFLERPITALDNVNVNNEGQVAPEAIKTGDIVSETTDTGFPPTGESHEKLSEFNGGDQSVDRKFSAIQHSGGDFLERPITTLDSQQSAHGGSSLEHTSMPTSSAI